MTRSVSTFARSVFLALLAITAIPLAAQVSAWVVGNTIHVTVSGTDPQSKQCCIGADIDEDPGFPPLARTTRGPSVDGYKPRNPTTNASCSQACGRTSDSFEFGCNSVGTHTVYGYYSDDHTGGYRLAGTATVTVTTPPPFFCPQFVLVPGGPRVLTHKYGDGFPDVEYLPKQTTDGEMEMKVKTVAAPAGTTIYLKITDPPDESQYGAPHSANDNVDTGAGSFGSSLGRTTTVSLPASGSVPFKVKTTLNASGDNYLVHASANPALHTPSEECPGPSGNANCQKTSLTAWKRFYVEPNEMYRTSQLIRSNILTGERLVYVDDRGFRRGDQVRLIHAPSFSRGNVGDTLGFHSEDFVIADVRRNNNPAINGGNGFEIELNAGVTQFYRTDATIGGIQLGDALVNLSRLPRGAAGPTYTMDLGTMYPAFYFAYVDLVTLPSNGVGVPFYDAMNDAAMTFVGGKWLAAKRTAMFPSNTGHAMAAATRDPLVAAGQQSLGSTIGAFSYVWWDSIDEATSGPRSRFPLTSGHNAQLMTGEVLVHELAHQWNVNSGDPGEECNRNSYDNAALFCHGNGPQNSGQYDDNHIAWHYVGTTPATADSEYMDIRKASEPKP